MRFLCLPGAYGSAKNFRVQLGPLADELESRGLASFKYSQGKYEVEPPPGMEDYFGTRPLYRFVDTSEGVAPGNLRRLRHVPHIINAEDAIRMLQDCSEAADWHQRAWRDALDSVWKTIDENPDVDAILGYSEGAMVAASLVVEEAMRAKAPGYRRRIRFAIFISGAPPLKFEGSDRVIAQLADEAGTVIDIPTFHIFGCDDVFLNSAIALYNVCKPSVATMFDHGLGHIVPRDAENVQIIADMLQKLVPKIEAGNYRGDSAACLDNPEATGSEVEDDGLLEEEDQKEW
ncbi:hypothetical protein VTK56DRAFT_3084 [Thermocarpiscus australiensis]